MEQDGIFYDGVLLRHQCRNHAARFESVVDLRHHVAVPLHDRAKILSDAVGEKQVVLRSVFRQSACGFLCEYAVRVGHVLPAAQSEAEKYLEKIFRRSAVFVWHLRNFPHRKERLAGCHCSGNPRGISDKQKGKRKIDSENRHFIVGNIGDRVCDHFQSGGRESHRIPVYHR